MLTVRYRYSAQWTTHWSFRCHKPYLSAFYKDVTTPQVK
jgi:hypothetical protein